MFEFLLDKLWNNSEKTVISLERALCCILFIYGHFRSFIYYFCFDFKSLVRWNCMLKICAILTG